MKLQQTLAIIVGVTLLLTAINLSASGPVGVYAIIEKVVFEPNEASPERIQVWGVFAFADDASINNGLTKPGPTSVPQRGYLYFALPPTSEQKQSRVEWADLKAVAGTGQAVAFGRWGFVGRVDQVDSSINNSGYPPYFLTSGNPASRNDVRLRTKYDAGALPAIYATNAGIVKLTTEGNHAEIVHKLRELLQEKTVH